MKYISHIEEAPMFYASFGSFIHKLLERFYKGELSKEEMQTEYLLNFKEEVKGERPAGSIVRKYINAGREYLSRFQPLPYNLIGVEKEVHFDIDGIPFVGFIDYIGEKDGEIYVVDNKSRDLKPRGKRSKPTKKDRELDEMLRQLYIYSKAIKQEYGKFPKSLCFNCFRTGVFIEEPFNMPAYEEALMWAKSNIEDIKNSEDFYPNIEFFKCKYICGLHDECCYYELGGG